MDILTIKMPKSVYEAMPLEFRHRMELYYVDDPDFDYTSNETWQQAKKESSEAYKRLKEIEYKIKYP